MVLPFIQCSSHVGCEPAGVVLDENRLPADVGYLGYV